MLVVTYLLNASLSLLHSLSLSVNSSLSLLNTLSLSIYSSLVVFLVVFLASLITPFSSSFSL